MNSNRKQTVAIAASSGFALSAASVFACEVLDNGPAIAFGYVMLTAGLVVLSDRTRAADFGVGVAAYLAAAAAAMSLYHAGLVFRPTAEVASFVVCLTAGSSCRDNEVWRALNPEEIWFEEASGRVGAEVVF